MKNTIVKICAVLCFLLAGDLVREDLSEHLFNFHRLFETLHYWADPLALAATGVAHWHAPKHPQADKPGTNAETGGSESK